ncbi:MAG: carboxypeptidase-like regulatory domain-containing protein [Candidatus Hydrogenedentes bacterium]|nr:carboxypeptidase-like regulatory domain-containing protein [Candidatus Hydrogenedentota bacterium]
MRAFTVGLLLAIAAGLVSCDRAELLGSAEIRGMVVDIRGEPVPGVVVSISDPLTQCLTDGLGQYRLGTEPGRVELHFMKTGYTSGTMVIEDTGLGTVLARPLSLWCLPQTTGLFIFEDYKYRRTAPLKPRPYVESEDRVIYGVGKLTGIVETPAAEPLLLCYKMPSYDGKLCRLAMVEAASPETPTVKDTVWVFSESVPLAMAPVDEPDRLLWEVRLMGPLEPGIYAFHWGALDGYTSTDERIFVFAVAQASGESSIPPGAGAEPAPPAPTDDKAGAISNSSENAATPGKAVEEAPEEAPEGAPDEAPAATE